MSARIVKTAAALTLLAFSGAGAQSSQCPSGTTTLGIPNRQEATQDACQMTVDLFQYLAPQLGASIVGGNATLGQGGTLGGLGHFVIEARGNVVRGVIPDVADFPAPRTTGSSPAQTLPTKSQYLPMATADASIGLFKGFPVGVTNIGGVDLLVSGSYIPKVTASDVSVDPQTSVKFGWGGRLGLLQESLVSPGVSVTYLQRDLPTTDITGTANGATLDINNMTVKTNAWRLVVSKNLLVVGLAAGYGRDTYDQAATVQATVNNTPLGPETSDAISLSQSLSRNNIFGDLSFNFVIFKIVAEIGQVSGGNVSTFNSFAGGRADASRTYGSLGLRFGF
jgi:hypothetical protein